MTTISCKFTPSPKPAPGRTTKVTPPVRRRANPARVARMLALAHHVEGRVETGSVPDYATVAAALGVSRARLSQVTALLLLAPEIQAALLRGDLCASERDLRTVAARPLWSQQVAVLGKDQRPHVVVAIDLSKGKNMSARFTHFGIENGRVDLLAGDVTECVSCHRVLFRDHAFTSDGESATEGEPTSIEAQLALGRKELPDDAHREGEGCTHCDYCGPATKGGPVPL